MKTKIYLDSEKYTAGITLKDPEEPEEGSLALHTCENTGAIIGNRRKLSTFLGFSLGDFVCAHQTHSANFHRATQADRGRGSVAMDDAISDTDALYTYEPNLVLCCFTADCVPLILCNEKTGLAGVIHSGWGGTVNEIVPRVLEQLIRSEHNQPEDIRVFIGPAISQESFEVDRDVRDRFKALGYADPYISYNGKTGKYHIDNQLTVKKQCELAGMPPENIFVDRTCTFSSPNCFSYRRDKACGRHLSFIIRKEKTERPTNLPNV